MGATKYVVPFLWYLPDLNWGHTDFQSVALPTELRYRLLKSDAKVGSIFSLTNNLLNFLKKTLMIFHAYPKTFCFQPPHAIFKVIIKKLPVRFFSLNLPMSYFVCNQRNV